MEIRQLIIPVSEKHVCVIIEWVRQTILRKERVSSTVVSCPIPPGRKMVATKE